MVNTKLILEDLKKLLESELPQNEDVISIYDVSNLVRSKYLDYKDMVKQYDLWITEDAKQIHDHGLVYIHGFDYDTNKLDIKYKYGICDWDKIIFAKDDERGLYIEKSKLKDSKNFFAAAYKDISDLYDEFLKFKDLKTQYVEDKKSINSKFEFDIYAVSTTLKYIYEDSIIRHKEFEFSYDNCYDEYNYDCNSSSILYILKDYEDDLLKRIYVKIEDCPEWTRKILYNKRKRQLEEEKRKQKKLEFKRKIFSWIK